MYTSPARTHLATTTAPPGRASPPPGPTRAEAGRRPLPPLLVVDTVGQSPSWWYQSTHIPPSPFHIRGLLLPSNTVSIHTHARPKTPTHVPCATFPRPVKANTTGPTSGGKPSPCDISSPKARTPSRAAVKSRYLFVCFCVCVCVCGGWLDGGGWWGSVINCTRKITHKQKM